MDEVYPNQDYWNEVVSELSRGINAIEQGERMRDRHFLNTMKLLEQDIDITDLPQYRQEPETGYALAVKISENKSPSESVSLLRREGLRTAQVDTIKHKLEDLSTHLESNHPSNVSDKIYTEAMSLTKAFENIRDNSPI